ncbi:MAG: biotin/lipoyl-binding protein [bacterium]
MTEHEKTPTTPKAKPTRHGLLIGIFLLIVLGILLGIHYLRESSKRISTDDAYLTADITQIAPQVSGSVTHIYVKDDQKVTEGQLLVELDPSTYQANVEQAQANLEVAIAQANGAAASVTLTGQTCNAQLTQAQGGVAQATSSISGAQSDVKRATAAVEKATAAAQAANSNIDTAQAAVEAAIANKKRSASAVETAQAQVNTAKANVKACQAAVNAAQATSEKAARDAERYAKLLEQGAVSKALADQYASTARVAQAQLESAKEQVNMAQEAVSAREADIMAARDQVQASEALVNQAKAALSSARYSANASQADINQAIAQKQTTIQTVQQAEAKRKQAMGTLAQANTQPQQIAVISSGHNQAEAKINQARAALNAAKLQLGHTKIYAPITGIVSKKTVQIGALVQAGTPLMALTQTDTIYVVANYKETQLNRILPGQRAEVLIDALDDKPFTGHVASISAGTGSTFALLPADNASGNFTKVVQRVPVQIRLDPGQPGLERLRAGLSVNATIITR